LRNIVIQIIILLDNKVQLTVKMGGLCWGLKLISINNSILREQYDILGNNMICCGNKISFPLFLNSSINQEHLIFCRKTKNSVLNRRSLFYQYLSPLKLWVRISFMARCTRYNILW
jgi:hypothetical protein